MDCYQSIHINFYNVNPGLISPKRLFNWGGTIKKYSGWHDYWRSTPLKKINYGLVSSGVDIIENYAWIPSHCWMYDQLYCLTITVPVISDSRACQAWHGRYGYGTGLVFWNYLWIILVHQIFTRIFSRHILHIIFPRIFTRIVQNYLKFSPEVYRNNCTKICTSTHENMWKLGVPNYHGTAMIITYYILLPLGVAWWLPW